MSDRRTTRVKHLADINQRTLPESTDHDREIRYLDISGVGSGVVVAEPEVMTFAAAPSRARRLVRDGDTIVSTVRTYLRAVLPVRDPDPTLVVSTGFAVLTPRSDVDPNYFAWVAQSDSFVEEIVARSVGVSYPAINASEISDIRVPVVGLAQQRAIADYLDREAARIDALIEKKLEFSRILDTKIDSLIYELVGTIPTRRRLRHLAKLGTGHTPDRRNSEYWENCVIPWVTAEDLSSRGNSFEVLMDTLQKISALGVANSAAVVHPSGTVMLCRTASIGLICRIGIPMATTQAFATWSPGPELNSGFLMYALNSLRQEWMRLAFGSTHDTIYMPDLESVKIPFVPIAEQIIISRKLDTSTSRLLEAKELLHRQRKTLKERRQALITAAVTGEIEIPEVAA